jgi:peptidoglycan/LPS O-acetylase OafA/YrhL
MKRLYLLDTLRGLASLSVVVWHYQHFYFIGVSGIPADFNRAAQSFYEYLPLLYNEGSRAVYVFFTLSGFIFFYQYSEAIRTREVGAGEFAVLRFSRLWPLHIATLLFVALLQALSLHLNGEFIVYPCNNWKRFLINAMLISDWLPSGLRCTPFNGPVWTLSDEIFLYVTFFFVVLLTPKRWLKKFTFLMILLGALIYALDGYHLLGEPLLCFFAGGLMWFIWRQFPWRVTCVASVVVFLGSGIYLARSDSLSSLTSTLVLDMLTYPSLVLFLASVQERVPLMGRRVRLVGDITYSTYLLHFPLQLAVLLLVKAGLLFIDFSEPAVWVIFFATLIGLSSVSFHLFEMPVQRLLRSRLLMKPVVAVAKSPQHLMGSP